MRTEITLGLELEAGIVGALLAQPDRIHDLPAGFKADHLSQGVGRRIFQALERLSAGGKLSGDAVPVVAAEARLSDQERDHAVSNLLALSAGSALRQYAEQLMDRRRREGLRAVLAEGLEALNSGKPTDDAVSSVTSSLLDLSASATREVVSMREATFLFLDHMDEIKAGKAPRIRTGFPDVDELLHVRPAHLVVIAARPGDGKTTFGLQWAAHVASEQRHVLVHSLEMPAEELVAVNLAREARMDSRKFYSETEKIDAAKVLAAADRLLAGGDGFLHFNDSHYGLGAISRITEKLHRRLGLALVVVDYLQLVEADNAGRGASREERVAMVSRGLKRLAMRLKVPVAALCQLNRDVEKRGQQGAKGRGRDQDAPALAPSPRLSDLRESGAIEQDANAVCFIHNPFRESTDRVQRAMGPFDFIVAKQRMGPKNVAARLLGDLERSAFRSYRESSSTRYVPDAPALPEGDR